MLLEALYQFLYKLNKFEYQNSLNSELQMTVTDKLILLTKSKTFFDNLFNVWMRIIVFSIQIKFNADESSMTTCKRFISNQSK